jgi:hypothetical protein
MLAPTVVSCSMDSSGRRHPCSLMQSRTFASLGIGSKGKMLTLIVKGDYRLLRGASECRRAHSSSNSRFFCYLSAFEDSVIVFSQTANATNSGEASLTHYALQLQPIRQG